MKWQFASSTRPDREASIGLRTGRSEAPRIDECTNTVGLRGEVRAFGLARSKGGVPNKKDVVMPLPRRKAKAAYRPSQKKLESLESERYMKSKVSLSSLAISLALSERSPHPAVTARLRLFLYSCNSCRHIETASNTQCNSHVTVLVVWWFYYYCSNINP